MLTDIPHLQTDIRAINAAVLTHMVASIRASAMDACWRFGIARSLAKVLGDASATDITLLADVEELIFVLAEPAAVEARLMTLKARAPGSLPLGRLDVEMDPEVFAINVAYLQHLITICRSDLATASVRCGLSMPLARRLQDLSLSDLHSLASSPDIRFTPRSADAIGVRLSAIRQDPQGRGRDLFRMASALWGAAA